MELSDTVLVAVPLTDEWGSAYLQIVVTILVFALGLPAILIQTITGPELHRISVARRHFGSASLLLVTLVSWLLLFGVVTAYQAKQDWQWVVDDWVVGLVAIGLVGCTVLLSWWRMRLPARERLTRHIVREAVRVFGTKGTVPDSAIEDLVELGTGSPRRHDRKSVLSEMQKLVRRVRSSGQYKGHGLEALILAVPRVAADPSHSLDDGIVLFAAEVLLEASRPLDALPSVSAVRALLMRFNGGASSRTARSERTTGESPTPDMALAVRAFIRLVDDVALRSAEPTVNTLLQKFSALDRFPPTLSAGGLAAVGQKAAAQNRFHIAAICMTHIEDLIFRSTAESRVRLEATLIGLATHVGASSPMAWRTICERPWVAELLSPSTPGRIAEYVDLFISDSDYITAGLVTKLVPAPDAIPTVRARDNRPLSWGARPQLASSGTGMGAAVGWTVATALALWCARRGPTRDTQHRE